MIELENIKEVEKHFSLYKYCALYNSDNQPILRYNAQYGKPYEKRKQEILTHLTSELTPPGLYVIRLKTSQLKNSEQKEIIYKKGNPENLEAIKAAINKPGKVMDDKKENFLSYERALSLETEIIKLTGENATLKSQVEQLTADLEEAEQEAEEAAAEKKTLSEAAGTGGTIAAVINGLKEFLPTITGMINTHFELKQQHIKAIQEARQQPPTQPTQPPQANDLDDDQKQILNYLQFLKTQAPEEYNKILQSLKPGNNEQ